MHMPTRNRRIQLVELLHQGTVQSVRYLSDQLGVSELTIRRDLDALQAEGVVERLHGGVKLLDSVAREMDKREISFYVRRDVAVAEKRAIAQAALPLVLSDRVVFVDASTTGLYLAQAIPSDRSLTIVTHSAYLPIELAGRTNIQVICTGGMFHPTSLCYLGPAAESALRQFNTSRAFMGLGGLTVAEGCTDANVMDVQLKSIARQRTKELIVMADHSKIGNMTLSSFAAVDQVTTLITDEQADPTILREICAAGVNVVVAPRLKGNGR